MNNPELTASGSTAQSPPDGFEPDPVKRINPKTAAPLCAAVFVISPQSLTMLSKELKATGLK